MNDPIDVWEHSEIQPPPFKMRTETAMEKYRHDTFWTKEPETIEWIRSFGPHDVFFDVGANVGVYSMYAASLFPEMIIIAFEPMPINHKALRENVLMNGFNIVCFPFAVGNKRGTTLLSVPETEAGKTGAQMGKKVGVTSDPAFEVDTLVRKLWRFATSPETPRSRIESFIERARDRKDMLSPFGASISNK